MSDDHAELACDPTGLGRSAHFWIEARDKSAAEIGQFFIDYKALYARAIALREAGKNEEYKEVAAEYNALTEAWGFTR